MTPIAPYIPVPVPGVALRPGHGTIATMGAVELFRNEIRRALDGRAPISVAVAAGLPRNSIRQILKGHEPKLSRAAVVADALGLEFYIGPPRSPTGQPNELLRILTSMRVGLEQRDARTHRLLRELLSRIPNAD